MSLTLTLDLPDDVRDAALQIEDLAERLQDYVRQQTAFERWRRNRYSTDARQIGEEARRDAEAMREVGFDSAAEGRKFLELWDRLANSKAAPE